MSPTRSTTRDDDQAACNFNRTISKRAFFTIGHSTRPLAAFIDLLVESACNFVVDVRTNPRSLTNPQFNVDTLPAALRRRRIGYEHVSKLGGFRKRPAGDSHNTFWTNMSFRNYADYALSQPFREGLAELVEIGSRHRCAVMCAELVWWRCHRRIISDYLLADDHAVYHIMAPGKVTPATPTPAAVKTRDGSLVYPAAEISEAGTQTVEPLSTS